MSENFLMLGIIWPLQGMPKFMQIIGCCFPFAFPSIAMRNVVFKDSAFADFDVQMALIVLLVWIIVPLELSLWMVKKKEKSSKTIFM